MDQILRSYSKALILLLIATIILTFDRLGTLSLVRKTLSAPFEITQIPLFIIKNNISARVEFLINLTEIEKDNQILTQKLAEITAENAKLQNILSENEALRAQLGFFGNKTKSIPSQVLGISRPLIIAPERVENLQIGASVTFGNNFVGTLTEVGTKLAKVKLPTDPSSSIAAVVLLPSGPVHGNLVGRYGKIMVLEKIEKQEIIPPGSLVQTAGEENIPTGLILGKVNQVERKDTDPFLFVEVESLVDFSRLTTVFILSS